MEVLLEKLYKTFIAENRYLLLIDGFKNTLVMSFFAIIIGVIIGIIVALIRELCKKSNKKHKIVLFICNAYVNITRAMPPVLRLLIIYYFLFSNINIDKLIIGTIAFGIGSGAFVAEIIRSGINSVDKSQTEAAQMLGLNYYHRMRYIVLPQALKNMIPALGNELIAIIIETSIAGYIGIKDMTKIASIISSRTFDYLTPLIIISVFYIIIIFGLKLIMNKIERRLKND